MIKFIKFLTNEYKRYKDEANVTQVRPGLDDNYMIPFNDHQFATGVLVSNSGSSEKSSDKQVRKIPVKPKDVLDELERVPTNWSLNEIDAKIDILRDKVELITQHYAKREVEALILCLENRKSYTDVIPKSRGKTYKSYFGNFDATTEDKIDILLSKYDLVVKESDIFIPEFPDDAIKIMKDYTEVVEKLAGKKPRFYVIATASDFRDADGKRDPILLSQSPFGFYYYILGAWDKEMLYLPEL